MVEDRPGLPSPGIPETVYLPHRSEYHLYYWDPRLVPAASVVEDRCWVSSPGTLPIEIERSPRRPRDGLSYGVRGLFPAAAMAEDRPEMPGNCLLEIWTLVMC